MKHIKRSAFLLLCIMLLAAAFPLSVSASVKISNKTLTLTETKSKTLKITGTNKKVTWSSSNNKVAVVSQKGKVTAKKKGTATITAKAGGKKYTCKVTVKALGYPKGRWITAGSSASIEVKFSKNYVYYYQYAYDDYKHTKVIRSWKNKISSIKQNGDNFTIVVTAPNGKYMYRTSKSTKDCLEFYSLPSKSYSESSSIWKKGSW